MISWATVTVTLSGENDAPTDITLDGAGVAENAAARVELRGGNDFFTPNPDLTSIFGSHWVFGDDGNDQLYGGAGRDTLDGGAGDDVLYGGLGNDRLFGGNGNDRLYGGGSSDRATGGDGNDIFVFFAGEGRLVIEDFSRLDGNSDRISLSVLQADGNFRSLPLAELQVTTQLFENVMSTRILSSALAPGDVIFLKGVENPQADWFFSG